MDVDRHDVDAAGLSLERELANVRGAIELVAQGGVSRIVLGGLRFGEPVIEAALRMGREAGVRVVPLWTSDESGADLAIERIEHA